MKAAKTSVHFGFKRSFLLLAAITVAGVTAALMYRSNTQPTLTSRMPTHAPVISVAPSPTIDQPIASVPDTDTNGSSSASTQANPPTTTTQPPFSSSPANTATATCVATLKDLTKKYDTAVRKEKKTLDDQLSFPPVGSLISIEFVNEYNNKVKKLYDSFVQSASAANCVFTVSPAYLAHTYPN